VARLDLSTLFRCLIYARFPHFSLSGRGPALLDSGLLVEIIRIETFFPKTCLHDV